ncbi:hypothetical protein [Kitasatospora phosalacinea]|uniref:Uncharacterized protein n=1 Tax=Kitasatospora phosalacinea TaxID=2065 RepID=A0A9W6PKT6_9ACTN|nr:hypothetical protein [Kitasatospora phosalacinea]GLW58130.1 hypothetical protein Kpho01_61410 [Kitasatospora phosalacinea]
MDEHNKQLRGRRVYGAEPGEDPGPEPGHEYRELVGGPLDGQLVDVTGWDADMLECGAALIAPLGHYGAGGRAHYEPRPDDPHLWDWEGDTA